MSNHNNSILTSQKQSKPDPQSLTLLFKQHKTTILLMLPPHGSITTAKEALIQALKARNLTEINGDSVPDDPSAIELGVAVDKSDPEKGWTRLEVDVPGFNDGGKSKKGAVSLQAADLRNGQVVAFRFRRSLQGDAGEGDVDAGLDLKDQGWDVVLPSLEEDEGEEES